MKLSDEQLRQAHERRKKNGDHPTLGEIPTDKFVDILHAFLLKELDPIVDAIDVLKKRIASLEAKSGDL